MKPPTLEEVREHIKTNGFYDVNPEKFWNYYEMVGWSVGKYSKPMKKWKSAVVTWTKTTAHSRQVYLTQKCFCGCGNKPTIIIDGNAYAGERCLQRQMERQNKPIGMELAKGLFKKVPNEPKPREIWKEIKQLKEAQ